MVTRRRLAGGTIVLTGALAAFAIYALEWHGGSTNPSSNASPLTVIGVPTPRFQVPRYDTSGKIPQVRGGDLDLSAANAALRETVLIDQRAFEPYARKEKAGAVPGGIARTYDGVYRTAVDRNLVSASTEVVSALLPLTAEVFPGQPGGDHWLGMTIRVPSGSRIKITDLFADSQRALPILAAAWKKRIRRTEGGPCIQTYRDVYKPTVANYRAFALTPKGVAVGSPEVGACYRLVAVVPYRVLRPYLSKLGAELVSGVRPPRWTGRNPAIPAASASGR